MDVLINTDNLGRYFGNIRAVDGVSFEVKRGEVLGFLGPNGAGKSTTMKMLTCFLAPTFGSASVAGFNIQTQSREVRKSLGYLPENAPLYGEMEVRDFLSFIAEIRGIESKKISQAVSRVVELTHLQDVVQQRIETLSKGFKRRVGLAQALIHDPEVLILDEPTDGLDPNQKHEVRQLIRQMADTKCIILSTHILEEVDEVCTRAIIIAKGKIVADDSPDGLRRRSSRYGAVCLQFDGDVPGSAFSEIEKMAGVKKVESLKEDNSQLRIIPAGESPILPVIAGRFEQLNWSLRDIHLEQGQLDQVFREITQSLD